ncbi:hypothetical protein AAULR_01605 [Lacticaseibacillus rhamnosus MTCC 5462]|nr:hypothetical protein AAULR_01605 [Lacticaseibacillus rhamnosus MTCC 5462]
MFLTNIGKRVAAHQSAIATPTQIKPSAPMMPPSSSF